MVLSRESGEGRLYYRAFLTVNQPVELTTPIDRGLTISRRYEFFEDCTTNHCKPVTSISLSELTTPLLVRLTLTIPEEMHYLVVEDWIPAGSEIIDTSLKTSQQGYPIEEIELFDPFDPFGSGWGKWLFGSPQFFDDHVRWIARMVPPGTYELTYQLVPFQTGEYRVIPAHAYQYYFPEVEGSSAGMVFGISP